MKYFLSFVEEGIFNPKYQGYVGGRIEVYTEESQWAVDEIRFLTNKVAAFYALRDKYDFKEVGKKKLTEIEKIVKKKFHDTVR